MLYAIIKTDYESVVFCGETQDKLDKEITSWLDDNLSVGDSLDVIFLEELEVKKVTYDYVWSNISGPKLKPSTVKTGTSLEV